MGDSIFNSGLKVVERPDIIIHHYKEEKENNLEKQKKYLRIAYEEIKANPKNARAHYTIASISIYLKDYETSLKHIQLANEYGYDKHAALMGWAGTLARMKREDDALKIYIKALREGIKDPIIYYYIGNIYYNKKRYDEAVKYLDTFIKFNPPLKENALKLLNHIRTNVIDQKEISYEFNFLPLK